MGLVFYERGSQADYYPLYKGSYEKACVCVRAAVRAPVWRSSVTYVRSNYQIAFELSWVIIANQCQVVSDTHARMSQISE